MERRRSRHFDQNSRRPAETAGSLAPPVAASSQRACDNEQYARYPEDRRRRRRRLMICCIFRMESCGTITECRADVELLQVASSRLSTIAQQEPLSKRLKQSSFPLRFIHKPPGSLHHGVVVVQQHQHFQELTAPGRSQRTRHPEAEACSPSAEVHACKPYNIK